MLWIISNIESEEDRTFVEDIYIRYEKQMYLIANNVLKNHHDAQDCVHETVKIIIDSLDKFKSAYQNRTLDSIVIIACRNCAINMYNKRKYRVKHETSSTIYDPENDRYTVADIADPDAELDKMIVNRENLERLQALIASLDPIYRDVLMLKCMDLDYNEISKIMSISPASARQRVHRARSILIANAEM
ncbi:MAG: sigma-70 family RNA polymerase sigma factor [Clostridia bacterium]|nr:sigma-70 family RNA polymerase sigma factor [Clostridia bacterium]